MKKKQFQPPVSLLLQQNIQAPEPQAGAASFGGPWWIGVLVSGAWVSLSTSPFLMLRLGLYACFWRHSILNRVTKSGHPLKIIAKKIKILQGCLSLKVRLATSHPSHHFPFFLHHGNTTQEGDGNVFWALVGWPTHSPFPGSIEVFNTGSHQCSENLSAFRKHQENKTTGHPGCVLNVLSMPNVSVHSTRTTHGAAPVLLAS